ncbi:MAG: hypothetical protein JST87_05475 [Bacteroidetes bacterium]|nr:hypothetical protein [Bacteroidota bacterium]
MKSIILILIIFLLFSCKKDGGLIYKTYEGEVWQEPGFYSRSQGWCGIDQHKDTIIIMPFLKQPYNMIGHPVDVIRDYKDSIRRYVIIEKELN